MKNTETTKGYAYLDKYGILHISEEKDEAIKYALFNEKVVETELPFSAGYPVDDEDNAMVVDMLENKIKCRGEEVDLDELREVYPALVELSEQCAELL